MLFNTIDEYDNELTDIESRLRGMEERMKQYPERRGISINYYSIKQLQDIILKDREDHVKMIGENTKVHVNNEAKHDFSLQSMSEIKLDITLENSTRNVTLTHEDALKVYNILSR